MPANDFSTLSAILTRTVSEQGWRRFAACAEADLTLFFPIVERAPESRSESRAKQYCLSCPVVAECLNWALSSGEQYGVFGGLTATERRPLRRRDVRTAG